MIDLDDLEYLSKIMMDESKPPPTLLSLLENHEYFIVEVDDQCLMMMSTRLGYWA